MSKKVLKNNLIIGMLALAFGLSMTNIGSIMLFRSDFIFERNIILMLIFGIIFLTIGGYTVVKGVFHK